MTTAAPEQVREETNSSGRDEKGRFTRGNAGGPGNPYARQVGKLRGRLLERLAEGELDHIADTLIGLAKAGDLQAIKLLFAYTLGKPAEAVNPDRLDEDEWDFYRKTGTLHQELEGLLSPDPVFALEVLRAARPAMVRDYGRMMGQAFQQ